MADPGIVRARGSVMLQTQHLSQVGRMEQNPIIMPGFHNCRAQVPVSTLIVDPTNLSFSIFRFYWDDEPSS